MKRDFTIHIGTHSKQIDWGPDVSYHGRKSCGYVPKDVYQWISVEDYFRHGYHKRSSKNMCRECEENLPLFMLAELP